MRKRARYTVAARCPECGGYHDNPQRRFDRREDAQAYARKWNVLKPSLQCHVFFRHFRKGGTQIESVNL